MILLARLLLFFALSFGVLVAPSLAVADDEQPVSLEHELRRLSELASNFDNSVTNIENLGVDGEVTENYFLEHSSALLEISKALSEGSVIDNNIQDQRRIIDDLALKFEEDKTLMLDGQTEIIATQITERRDQILQTIDEIAILKARVDENIAELEALRLFSEYQLRLARFDVSAGHFESAARIMEESVQGLEKVSGELTELSTSLASQ